MTRAIKCDKCGKCVKTGTLYFDIEHQARMVGGKIVDSEGNTHDFDHAETDGDLCSECSTDLIQTINRMLKE